MSNMAAILGLTATLALTSAPLSSFGADGPPAVVAAPAGAQDALRKSIAAAA
jgi:hypothetical protein